MMQLGVARPFTEPLNLRSKGSATETRARLALMQIFFELPFIYICLYSQSQTRFGDMRVLQILILPLPYIYLGFTQDQSCFCSSVTI